MPNPIDIKVFGLEPSWEIKFTQEIDRQCAIGKALNWYNYMSDAEEHKSWLIDYVKSNNFSPDVIDTIKSLNADQIDIQDGEIAGCLGFATGVIARMKMLGAPLDQRTLTMLDRAVEIVSRRSKPIRKETGVKPNVQLYIQEQFSKIVEVLETKCDRVLKTQKIAEGSTQLNLQNAIKTMSKKENVAKVSEIATYINSLKNIYCKKIADYYQPVYQEICCAVEGSDNDIVEAYASYNKTNLKNLKLLIEEIIKNCNLRVESESKMPTIRRKRRRSPIDIVKKLKYKKEDKEYNLTSTLPSKIVEAQRLLIFNTKYRTVSIFEADSPHGLSVKGTTVIGYDAKKSKTKKVRKPKDFFDKIKNKGIKAVRSAFESLKCTEKPAKGRINEDTILYGVYE